MPTIDIPVGPGVLRGEILARDLLDLSAWSEEGRGHLTIANNALRIEAMAGGYSAFYREPLPADLLISLRATILPPPGAGNLNLLTHCAPSAHFPISETGAYDDYQTMPNYIVTFVHDEEPKGESEHPGRTRLRRNPGFALLQEQHPESEPGREYHLVFASYRGRLRYWLDGKLLHEWQDPEPLMGGLFALRTYKTTLECRDLVLCRPDGAGCALDPPAPRLLTNPRKKVRYGLDFPGEIW